MLAIQKPTAAIVECSTHRISRLLALIRFAVTSLRLFLEGLQVINEHKQVLDHSELFVGIAWYPKVQPHQWCEAVGIRPEDTGYLDAIATSLDLDEPQIHMNPSPPRWFLRTSLEEASNGLETQQWTNLAAGKNQKRFTLGAIHREEQQQDRWVLLL